MLKPRFERTMHRSYLMLECDSYQKSFEENMLLNQIPGVLPFHIVSEDEITVFSYEITQKLSFHEYIKQTILNYEIICTMLEQVIINVKHARNYLLNPNHFIIDTAYIYVGDEGSSYWLCYYIGYEHSIRDQLIHLCEDWMKEIDYSDQKTVKVVYELYQMLREESCTYDQILELIKKKVDPKEEIPFLLENDVAEDHSGEIVAMEEELLDEREVLYYPVNRYVFMAMSIFAGTLCVIITYRVGWLKNLYGKIDTSKLICMILIIILVEGYIATKIFCKENRCSRMKKDVSYISFQDKEDKESFNSQIHSNKTLNSTHMSEEGNNLMQQKMVDTYDKYKNQNHYKYEKEQETVVLFGEDKTQLLIRHRCMVLVPAIDKDETIHVTTEQVIIGSSRNHADIIIPYKTISRQHARIYLYDENYYLEDLSSTNGTFYCGEKLEHGKKQILAQHDQVQFAEFTYEVKLIEDETIRD